MKRDISEKGIVAVCGTAVSLLQVHVISPTLHLFRPAVVSRLLRLDSSHYSAAVGVRTRPRDKERNLKLFTPRCHHNVPAACVFQLHSLQAVLHNPPAGQLCSLLDLVHTLKTALWGTHQAQLPAGFCS
ncbi:unnamed protein product [Boreogadus saida]